MSTAVERLLAARSKAATGSAPADGPLATLRYPAQAIESGSPRQGAAGIWYWNGEWRNYVGNYVRTALQELLIDPAVTVIRVFGADGQFVDVAQ